MNATTCLNTHAACGVFPMLPENPSKQQEIDHLTSFVNGLPACSYLASYLQDAVPMACMAMRDDMTIELLPAIRREHSELLERASQARKELAKLTEEVQKLRHESAYLKRQSCNARDELREFSQQLQTLASQAANSYQRAVSACVEQQSR